MNNRTTTKDVMWHVIQMRNVNRFQGLDLVKKSDLSSHSLNVGVIFLFLCKEEGIEISTETALKVFLHDITETVTGDLNYLAKNTNQETKKSWEIIEENFLKKHYSFLIPFTDSSLKETLTEDQFNLFKAADILEILFFLRQERKIGNNQKKVLKIIETCQDLLKTYKYKSVENFKNFVYYL